VQKRAFTIYLPIRAGRNTRDRDGRAGKAKIVLGCADGPHNFLLPSIRGEYPYQARQVCSAVDAISYPRAR
jgi:hypothetical protein